MRFITWRFSSSFFPTQKIAQKFFLSCFCLPTSGWLSTPTTLILPSILAELHYSFFSVVLKVIVLDWAPLLAWTIIIGKHSIRSSSNFIHKIRITLSNFGRKICKYFHVLAQFLFTTSETNLGFINRKWMYELPDELPNELRLRILGN